MEKFDITIKEIKKVPWEGLQYSSLSLLFKGKHVTPVLVNTFRRILIDDIPTYACPPEKIEIKKENNTSKFNNDYMKLRLSQLPIMKIKSSLCYLDPKYWKNVNYSEDYERHPDEKQIEIYINSKNTTDTIYRVTTSDLQFREDGKKIIDKYNTDFPIVLIDLCPGEIFKCHMVATLGIGKKNIIWSSVSKAYYEINEQAKECTLIINSNGQYDEYDLMWKACRYIQFKLEEIQNILEEKQKSIDDKETIKKVDLVLDDETFTIGGILTDILQNRQDIIYAGITAPSYLTKCIEIKIEYVKETDKPYIPIFESIAYISGMMKYIEKIIYDMGKKYIEDKK